MPPVLPLIGLYALLALAAPGPIPRVVVGVSLPLAALLIHISLTDIRRLRIPDPATAALALAGLAAWALLDPAALPAHMVASALTGALFWALAEAAYRLRGRDALGLGDAKLAAAGALWLGPGGVASMVLIAALSGLALGLAARRRAVAFGPHLAISIWLVWLYGPVI